jgi:DNA-binding CsgD family transcriptional regulator
VVGMGAALSERAVTAVERACRRSDDPDELLACLSDVVHRYVPHDGSAWFGIDPASMIATSPSRIEHLDPSLCDTFWHLEFHEHDATVYSSLAKGDGAGGLRLMLDDRIGTSVRYRDFLRPHGFSDELRGTFRDGDNTWGVVSLYREQGRKAFDADEVALVKAIGEPIAAALKAHVRAESPWLGQPSAPGLVVIDGAGRAVSVNSEARSWLRDLLPIATGDGLATGDLDALDALDALDVNRLRELDQAVPTPLYALVSRARAVADGRERAPARLRMRDRRGRWLVVHASVLEGPAAPGHDSVALVFEAAKSAEIAPIVIEAYGLTKRERDVLSAIARGGSTSDIATELFLSPHTVRDYVKTVFEKVGVSSRGELVAKLFGEHYSDRLHETMVHEH